MSPAALTSVMGEDARNRASAIKVLSIDAHLSVYLALKYGRISSAV